MIATYSTVLLATACNIFAVYFMKLSAGLTAPWPTLGMLITNMLTLWLLGRAFSFGANVSLAVTILTVGVMIGSYFIGLLFGERVTLHQVVGGSMAIAGVIVSSMANSRSA